MATQGENAPSDWSKKTPQKSKKEVLVTGSLLAKPFVPSKMESTRTPVPSGSVDSACSSAPVNSPETVHLKNIFPMTRAEYERSTARRTENIPSDPRWWKDEKPFSCPKCKRRYTQKQHLMLHKRLHDGNQHYTCSECEKIYGGNATPLKPLN